MKVLFFRFWLVLSVLVSGVVGLSVGAQGPGDTNPWEDPALHQCIDNWLTGHMNDPTVCPSNIGPCRGVDEWGNLMTAGYVSATQPDDWHDWYNRWHRIACLWEEPTSGWLRTDCQAPPCNWQPGMPQEPPPVDQPPSTAGPVVGPTATVLDHPPAGFTFYAVYKKLFSAEQSGVNVTRAVMSDDGQQILFAGTDQATGLPLLFLMRTDGSAPTPIALPDLEGRWIEELAIDYDGSHAYFRASQFPMGDTDWLFAVQNGAATRIFETAPYLGGEDPISSAERIQTTADGRAVYFRDRDDVWMVMNGGGPPQKVLEDTNVPRDDALVAGQSNVFINNFAISDDASTIAFIGYGRADPDSYDGISSKTEVFVYSDGGFIQITNDVEPVIKEIVGISGDGSTVVYASASPRQWFASHHGGPPIPLEDAGFNFGGMDLTFDGSLWFYFDADAHGGRIVRTDATGGLDLFPTWSQIMIEATFDPSISDDGTVISFRVSDGVYVGFLNNPGAVPSAPVIQSISFAAPEGESEYAHILTAPITGDGALVAAVDQLLEGRRVNEEHAPVGFSRAPNDEGVGPDTVAGDGVFSCGGRHHSSGTQTVRVSAKDTEGTVTVADVLLTEP
jgi:hypothetical protein